MRFPRPAWRVLAVTCVVGATALASLGAIPVSRAASPSCSNNSDDPAHIGTNHPVVLVHGWTGTPLSDTRKALERLPSSGGRAYLLFDYAAASTQWPDRPDIRLCLARYIERTSKLSHDAGGDGIVYLVVHSMGGLAVRFALDQIAQDGVGPVADMVGGVVSLDTPYQGSMWGNSVVSYLKSAINDAVTGVEHGAAPTLGFPTPGARAWACLAGGPRLTWPAGCAAPPPLDPRISLYQLGGDVTVRRTLFGHTLYSLDLASDGIVGIDSQEGSRGGNGKLVATQVGFRTVSCGFDPESVQAINVPAGFWYDVFTDNFLLDLYQGHGSALSATQVGTILRVVSAAPCSHDNMASNPDAIVAVDRQLTNMIRRQGGLSQVHDLLNAPIPASCRHPATLLQGYRRQWGNPADSSYAGGADLNTKQVLFGDVTGDGRSDAVAILDCGWIGVGWPELLLVYGPGTHLLGWYDLAKAAPGFEHVDVDGLTARDGGVDVRFRAYQGAGSDIATYRGRLTAPGGTVAFHTDGPLTISYGDGSTGFANITNSSDVSTRLAPAPKDFQRFIRNEWESIPAASASCPGSPTVWVQRYSHLGFASGGKGDACEGGVVLWYRDSRGWHQLAGPTQDALSCTDVDKNGLLKRAVTALGLPCWDRQAPREHQLGTWPDSGE